MSKLNVTSGDWNIKTSKNMYSEVVSFTVNNGVMSLEDAIRNANLIAQSKAMYNLLDDILTGRTNEYFSVNKEIEELLAKARGEHNE